MSLQIAAITDANPTGLVCSGMIWGPPAVDPAGDPVPVKVTELPTTIADVVSSIDVEGSATVVWNQTAGGPVNVDRYQPDVA